jgi:hypothetical protein
MMMKRPLLVGACTQRVRVYDVDGPEHLRNMRALHGVLMSLAWWGLYELNLYA